MNEEEVVEEVAVTPAPAEPRIVTGKKRSISVVWVIPLVAAIIAAGLAYKSIVERGPTIKVTFRNAAGLEAGVTRIKFKSVDVGEVDAIEISENLSHVIITASLVKDMEPHLKRGTRFWVVRPRLGLGGVSGLSTLISGAYIEIEPGPGEPSRQFEGLELPPVTPSGAPGLKLVLQAEELGSLRVGSPVYYRQIHVGEVERHRLTADHGFVEIEVFIREPYDKLVTEQSRFWNVSGIELSMGTDGVSLKTGSLETVLVGGIAFAAPDGASAGKPVEEGAVFKLHDSYKSIWQDFTHKLNYVLYFEGSVRGLNVGAPVEFRGTRVGSVVSVRLQYDNGTSKLQVPVVIEVEPERVVVVGSVEKPDPQEVIARFIREGLRAQLKTASFFTGQLYIELEFHPGAPSRLVAIEGGYPEFPTVAGGGLEALTGKLSKLAESLDRFELDKLVEGTVATVDGLHKIVEKLEDRLVPLLNRVDGTLEQARKTLVSLDGVIAPDSELRHDLSSLLEELPAAARSIRFLADYLERHPEALLYGKAEK